MMATSSISWSVRRSGWRIVDALAGAGQRTGRLQEQADALDLGDLVLVMQFGIGLRFFQMLFVVHRRGDDLAGIGDRRQQFAIGERERLRVLGKLLDRGAHLRQMRDHQIVGGQRIARGRQDIERGGDILDAVAFDQTEAIIVEAAEFHGDFWLRGLKCSARRIAHFAALRLVVRRRAPARPARSYRPAAGRPCVIAGGGLPPGLMLRDAAPCRRTSSRAPLPQPESPGTAGCFLQFGEPGGHSSRTWMWS